MSYQNNLAVWACKKVSNPLPLLRLLNTNPFAGGSWLYDHQRRFSRPSCGFHGHQGWSGEIVEAGTRCAYSHDVKAHSCKNASTCMCISALFCLMPALEMQYMGSTILLAFPLTWRLRTAPWTWQQRWKKGVRISRDGTVYMQKMSGACIVIIL
jgi:hypothetical protein